MNALVSTPYQLLPPLTAEERAALIESIGTFGILQPIIVDEAGNVIDGHHRAEIAAELGVDCPRVTVPGLAEDQKLEQALMLNMARRHLDAEQKQALARDLRSRGLSLRWISERTGIPRSTVHRLTEGVPNGTPEYVGGRDGKRYRAEAPDPTPEQIVSADNRRLVHELAAAGIEIDIDTVPLEGYRQWLNAGFGGWTPINIAADDPALAEGHYLYLARLAGQHMLRTGRLPHRPRWLSYVDILDDKRGRKRERDDGTRATSEGQCWYLWAAFEAGGFLSWCDCARIQPFGRKPKFIEPMDLYIAGHLWSWLGWVPDIELADVLTDEQRAWIDEGPKYPSSGRRLHGASMWRTFPQPIPESWMPHPPPGWKQWPESAQ